MTSVSLTIERTCYLFFSGTSVVLKSQFTVMASEILEKLALYPDVFGPAVEAMVSQYSRIKTDSSLVSALHSFGKKSETPTVHQNKKGPVSGPSRDHLRSCMRIGVQTGTPSRRNGKPQMGRGGSRFARGRPPKAPGKADILLVPVRRKIAPHSLSDSVRQNKTLGKTHSIK